MIRRFLSRNREYIHLLKALDSYVSELYANYVVLKFYEGYPLSYGETNDAVYHDTPLQSYVGVGGLFQNFKKGTLLRNITESDVTHITVLTFHECRHGMMFSKMKSGELPDAKYFEASHLAGYDNETYVKHNWTKFLSEVDAERFGLYKAGSFLTAHFGEIKAKELLLDYVNSRVRDSDYFVSYPKGKSRFDDIDDVFDAFDEAYERAKHAPRDYVLPKCQDVFQNFMYGEMSDEARAKFFAEQDGFQQDKMVAAVTLYHHPEYQSQYPVLRECDMSMEAMFGPTWYKSEADLESLSDVKSGTKVNRGIRHPRLNQKACGVELRELDMTHDGEDECEY